MSPELLACDVVIPTYRRPDLLEACLSLLREQTVPHQVIVVDDASGDGTPDIVRERFPEALLVGFERNRGFAVAANAGVRAGGAEAVVLLNNDVMPEPTFLEKLIEPIAVDPLVGMVAALLLRPDGAVDSFGLEADRTLAVFPRLWGEDPREASGWGNKGLLGPAGGAAAYRRVAYESVGGLDERLVSYNEDTDLALRIRTAGWKGAAEPEARAAHLGSATFGHRSSAQLYRLGFSRGFLLRKYGVLRDPRRALHTVAAESSSVAWQLLRTRESAGLRGRVAGWRSARPELPLPRSLLSESITLGEGIARRRAFRA